MSVHETSTELITEFVRSLTVEMVRASGERFGDALRQARMASGLTQEQLAEQAGISARTVSDIERGLRHAVYPDTARRLADALGLQGTERAAFAREASHGAGRATHRRSRSVGEAGTVAPLLPAPLTRLLGRDDELAKVVAALRSKEIRVLTLVGPGGIGKTRLAIEAANELRGAFADGEYFVSLAVTSDPSLVPALIARELGLAAVRTPVHEALRAHLRDRAVLLVLDTFEHVLSAAAFVAELAVGCPRASFLVTSRAPLRVRGEHQLQLGPLAVPDVSVEPARLDLFAATALFLERARAVKPDIELDQQTAASIAQICRRLDGLPLALELAAVRLRHMPIATVQEQLDHRLNLLVGGPRDLPPRHQTMRDAIAWSHDLLEEREQRLFRHLSVFAGGWSLSAAELICGEDPEAQLATLTALVDNNLIVMDEASREEARFGMLDVIREFAHEEAVAHDEADDLGRRHAIAFADEAEAAERAQGWTAQEASYRRLQVEQDNLRAALGWSLEHGETVLARRLAGALWLFWRRHADYSEARRWLDAALAVDANRDGRPAASSLDGGPLDGPVSADDPLRRKVMWGNAWISYYQGDYAQVRRLGDELLRVAELHQDTIGIRNGLTVRALAAMADQRFSEAIVQLEDGLRICRERCPPWLLATSLLNLGTATLHGPDLARSRGLLQEALAIYRDLDDRLFVARTKGYLGYVALLRGELQLARRLFAASLNGFREHGERFGIAEELQALSALSAAEGRDERAAELAGAAHGIWASMFAQALASDRPIVSGFLDPARRRLGVAAWRSARRRGQAMSIDAAVRLALESGRMTPPGAPT